MQIVDVLTRLAAAGVEIVPMQFESMVALISSSGILGIDYSKIKTDADLLDVLVHELAHYETGAFYTIKATAAEWRKAEGTANQRALQLMNPNHTAKPMLREA